MRKIDYKGHVYGHWTVIESATYRLVGKSRKAFALCRCQCGMERELQISNLRAGGSRSCGCHKRRPHISTTKSGETAAKCLMGSYRQHAASRDLSFEISFDKFSELTQGACHYCGIEPRQEYMLYRWEGGIRIPRINGAYIYNGIDRADSAVGYTNANCVSCCFACNHAKNDMPLNQFLEWIDRIYHHQHRPVL